MTKFLKVLSIILLTCAVLVAAAFCTYLIITKDAVLDENKLINPNQNILIYDDNGKEVVSASLSGKHKSVSVDSLNKDTINAFIASEDRTFYSHHGLNYKRMLKALYTNAVARSFKEGASTISQQLVKNTHLSHDKTIKRKLNEIRLTKQLERRYSKDEILEMYLNTIYFGHNCYGLESAAEFYFDKNADNLNLEESAAIVGLLTSPNNYSPFKNPEKCLSRRNTVLKAMLSCKFIDESAYNKAVSAPIEAKPATVSGKNSDYISGMFDELEDIDVSFYTVSGGCKIYTYLNAELQNYIENLEYESDNSVIVTALDGGVCAYKSTINGARRQPGSTVKPLMVYGPAIEEKQLSPHTKILDEKIDFNGYSPENYDKKYHGYVSVTDCIKNSYNVPAVKTLNSLTLKTAEKYLTRMNLALEDDEKNLSLALGGMKYGLSLKDLTDRYSIFPAGGNYAPSHFIKKIVDESGKTIYENQTAKNNVFSQGTCSLINSILMETSKSGTAKKLCKIPFDIATKTGTCGNEQGNTDAYAISYTSEHCIGVWLGDKNNARKNITGGNNGCNIIKKIIENLYRSYTPKNLDVTSGTSSIDIDAEEYFSNNKTVIADPLSPKLNIVTVKVLKNNEPKEVSRKFSSPTISTPSISVKNGSINIELCQTKYYDYLIKRQFGGKNTTIYDGSWQKVITDTPEEGIYTYTVIPYFVSENKKIYGQEITLPAVNLVKESTSPQVKIPDIAKGNWYDL